MPVWETGIGWYWTGGFLTTCWMTLCCYGLTKTGDWTGCCCGLTVLTSLTLLPVYRVGLTNCTEGCWLIKTEELLVLTAFETTKLVLWVFSWMGATFLFTVTTLEVFTVFTLDELKGLFDWLFINMFEGLLDWINWLWFGWKPGTKTLEFAIL